MKKLCSVVISLFLLCTLCTFSVTAAPEAEIITRFSEPVIQEDGTQLITLYISVSAPSEPYASLDFNLVSSNAEHLFIEKDGRNELDITFTSDYGGAFHNGRIDEESGAISYLIGIFSSMGGNAITDEVEICTVRLRYSGLEPQALSINDLKLVYKAPDGEITSEKIPGNVELAVISELLSFEDIGIPLASFPAETIPTESAGNNMPYLWIGLGLIFIIGLIALFIITKRKKAVAAKVNNQ